MMQSYAIRARTQRIFTFVREAFLREADRWALWLPVAMGLGVTIYFWLPTEPDPNWPRAAFLCLLLFVRARWRWLVPMALGVGVLVAGIGMAQWQAERVRAPVLERNDTGWVEGRVREVVRQPKSLKLTLDKLAVEGLAATDTPRRIILYGARETNAIPGERVRVKARLRPPPQAIVPGGYDMRRHYYFAQVGASGVMLSPIETVRTAETARTDTTLIQYQARAWVAERVREALPGQTGAVALSLVTSDQSGIDAQTQAVMRASGLSHVLSVSGLHLALFSGIVFWVTRALLAAVPWFALRANLKRIAAAVSLVASFGYLVVTAFPVPAVRAFVAVALLLLATLTGREPTPMRSVAWAALVILAYDPASLLSPSFQMSFAATVALVGFYEWVATCERFYERGWFARARGYVAASLATSLVAGLATAPLVAYHFQQTNPYGIAANLLVAPIVSCLIMPAVVLFFPLAAMGAQALALVPLGWGVDAMLWVARMVASWPQSAMSAPSPALWGVVAATFGGLWLAIWRGRMRWFGVLPVIVGLSSMLWNRPPDVLIDDRFAHVAVRLDDGRAVMLRGGARGYVGETWARVLGVPNYVKRSDVPEMDCETQGCVVPMRGKRVAVYLKTYTTARDCLGPANLILAPWPLPRECRTTPLIGWPDTTAKGAHAVTITPENIGITSAATGQVRPWTSVRHAREGLGAKLPPVEDGDDQ